MKIPISGESRKNRTFSWNFRTATRQTLALPAASGAIGFEHANAIDART